VVEQFQPRLVVIACNTASTIALDTVRAALDLPVVGTVPAIKPASEISRTRVIGVLGTQATVRQPYVDDLAARFAADCTVIRHGSPELVELAEAKLAGRSVHFEDVRAAAQPMFDARRGEYIDTVVLACTHFRLLDAELRSAFPGVELVDGAEGIARRIAFLTRDQAWPAARSPGVALFTGPAPTGPLLTALARYGLADVRTL
jgi:glutamate racemase